MTGYKRVLIKLSGEVFGGGKVGFDLDVIHRIAVEVADVAKTGVQVGIVVGGGNFFRGAELQQRGMERARADYMGMLGTVMNCLALQDLTEKHGVETRVQTAITMGQVAEPYIPRRAIRHMEKGRIVIFGYMGMLGIVMNCLALQDFLEKIGIDTRVQSAIRHGTGGRALHPEARDPAHGKGPDGDLRAGAGMPFFSTDTVAAQRALETRCEVILMGKQGVDGVYDSDPHKNPSAVMFDRLTYDEYLARNLKVADATGIAMARDNRMDMVFFNLSTEGNILRVVQGEKIGTLVSAG